MTEDQERPTPNKPLHGPRRTFAGPVLVVIAILAVVAVVFVLITWARYNT